MEFDEFLAMVCKRPLPSTPLTRVKVFARELAEGAIYGHWSSNLQIIRNKSAIEGKIVRQYFPSSDTLEEYLSHRWKDRIPDWEILVSTNYIAPTSSGFLIVEKAFELIGEAEPAKIFISYKRTESSAFSIYVLKALKDANLEAFLDIDLQLGEEWHGRLEERVTATDVLILLIGKETLQSEYVQKEIRWAVTAESTIYPIWQPSFIDKPNKWDGVPDDIADLMQNTHAIEIIKEQPQYYLEAITQLLNRFGITP